MKRAAPEPITPEPKKAMSDETEIDPTEESSDEESSDELLTMTDMDVAKQGVMSACNLLTRAAKKSGDLRKVELLRDRLFDLYREFTNKS